MTASFVAAGLVVAAALQVAPAPAGDDPRPTLQVRRCDDFAIDGSGRARAWQAAEWVSLRRREADGADHATRIKLLYSATGLYVLLEAADARLTATLKDFDHLWTEDVFEMFLWPDERFPLYFEYEVSPLGAELPLLIPNLDGDVYGWRPWRDAARPAIKRAVSVSGGPQQSGAPITAWKAEIFVPFDVLRPLPNRVPQAGTRWRANFYRIDYDRRPPTSWDWARVGPSFHEFQKFGTLVFQ